MWLTGRAMQTCFSSRSLLKEPLLSISSILSRQTMFSSDERHCFPPPTIPPTRTSDETIILNLIYQIRDMTIILSLHQFEIFLSAPLFSSLSWRFRGGAQFVGEVSCALARAVHLHSHSPSPNIPLESRAEWPGPFSECNASIDRSLSSGSNAL